MHESSHSSAFSLQMQIREISLFFSLFFFFFLMFFFLILMYITRFSHGTCYLHCTNTIHRTHPCEGDVNAHLVSVGVHQSSPLLSFSNLVSCRFVIYVLKHKVKRQKKNINNSEKESSTIY
jgi:hypothetical protein